MTEFSLDIGIEEESPNGKGSGEPDPDMPAERLTLNRFLSEEDSDIDLLSPEPEFIRDFQIIEEIGCGHIGQVLKCTNKIDHLVYAVKKSNNKINSKDH